MTARPAARKLARSVFYGWRIVAVVFVTRFISMGLGFYSYGVLFKVLTADFGGSRLGVAGGMAMMNVVAAAFAPFLGRLVDRGSIRLIICTGACLMAAGFLVASRIQALWQFYAVMGSLLALSAAMMGAIPSSAVVANWFRERRGMALGISNVGVSLSGVVMPLVATLLIGKIGWRGTYLVYAALAVVVVVPAVWLVIVNRPEDRGLQPDGKVAYGVPTPAEAPPGQPAVPASASRSPGWSRRRIFGEPNFWAIALLVALNFSVNSAVLIHIVAYGTDIGLERMAAALLLSTMAGFGVVGKVFFGWIIDRAPRRFAPGLATGLQALGLLLILNVDDYRALLVASAVFGLGMGGVIPIWAALIGAGFGPRALGSVMGLMIPLMLPIQIAGVPFAGWIFDRTGAYDVAFHTFLGAYGLALAALLFLRLPEVEPGSEPAPSVSLTGS